jgi:hypothetical protein
MSACLVPFTTTVIEIEDAAVLPLLACARATPLAPVRALSSNLLSFLITMGSLGGGNSLRNARRPPQGSRQDLLYCKRMSERP